MNNSIINKKFKLKCMCVLVFISISVNLNNVYAGSNLQDLSIVIASCDKYSGLWSPFFSLLFKYWPSLIDNNKDNETPIFLIANKRKFDHPRVQYVLFPNEISWSDNIVEALSKVQTKYVLYLQEDYFLTRHVNEELLAKMLNYIKEHNVAYLEISAFNNKVQSTKSPIIDKDIANLAEFTKHSSYRTSLQAGIWDKEALIWLIKSGETAVDFELAGSKRSEGMQRLFLAYLDVDKEPIQYINAVIGGLLLQSAVDYVHSQGIAFDPKLQPLPIDQNRKLILLKRKIFGMLKTDRTRALKKKIQYYFKKFIYS